MKAGRVFLLFGLCLAVLIGGVAFLTRAALELDREGREARRQAALEENVRLALWRMDATAGSLIARESVRPILDYYAPHDPSGPCGQMLQASADTRRSLNSSAYPTGRPEFIRLYFQVRPDGTLESARVPPVLCERPEEGAPRAFEEALRALQELWARGGIDREAIARALREAPRPEDAPVPPAPTPFREPADSSLYQSSRNVAEFSRRQSYAQQAVRQENAEDGSEKWSVGARLAARPVEGAMVPVWFGGSLVLVRKVVVGGREDVQGCWLDWEALKKKLLADVQDLLPGASLVPLAAGADVSRRLSALPLVLVPGPLPDEASDFPRAPVAIVLVVAWAGVLLAGAAVGLLLRGTVALSERRADFVSAVTHELRTPLTTLRMYTEMLADGTVTEPEKRQQYLETLRREALRLGHLVENVLSYSRIERGRTAGRVERLEVGEVVERCRERLAERALQAGMELVVEQDAASGLALRGDQAAIEQILFNLVDNACKYAAGAEDRRIHLAAAHDARHVVLRVSDHGPGIPADVLRRLFTPFSKSAERAAGSAPGVGLGLSLCRSLARSQGGRLVAEVRQGAGACFALALPRA